MTDYVKQHGTYTEFVSNRSWVILNSIEKRIREKTEAVGIPLKDWDISINYGIKTGCNEAFIIDKNKRDELIAKDKKSAEIIRPILRGRDVERYKTNFADLYLINTHNGNVSKNIPAIDVKNYPAIKEHLDEYWSKIKNREDQGITPYNLRSCAYTDEFSKQKIVYREISNNMDACFIKEDIFINNKSYMITGKNLVYLLGVMNSSLFNQIVLKNVNTTGGKGSIFLEKICIPLPNNNEKLSLLVLNRLRQENGISVMQDIEDEIDFEVASIYGLTDIETKYIRQTRINSPLIHY